MKGKHVASICTYPFKIAMKQYSMKAIIFLSIKEQHDGMHGALVSRAGWRVMRDGLDFSKD